jgi:hypothetical protein
MCGVQMLYCCYTLYSTCLSAVKGKRLVRSAFGETDGKCEAPNTAASSLVHLSSDPSAAALCCIYYSSHPSTYEPSVHIRHGYRLSHHIQGWTVRRKCMSTISTHLSRSTSNAHRRAKRSSLMPLPAICTSTKKMVCSFALRLINIY